MSILEMVQSSRCSLVGSNLWKTYFSGSGKLKFAYITPIWEYLTKAGIVLVRPSADFRPFPRISDLSEISANLLRQWMYIWGGRPTRKGQNWPKSAQNGQFQPGECSSRTIPAKDSLDFPWKKYRKIVKIDDTRLNIYWDKLLQVLVDSF